MKVDRKSLVNCEEQRELVRYMSEDRPISTSYEHSNVSSSECCIFFC